jgi:hypothetical protein
MHVTLPSFAHNTAFYPLLAGYVALPAAASHTTSMYTREPLAN